MQSSTFITFILCDKIATLCWKIIQLASLTMIITKTHMKKNKNSDTQTDGQGDTKIILGVGGGGGAIFVIGFLLLVEIKSKLWQIVSNI